MWIFYEVVCFDVGNFGCKVVAFSLFFSQRNIDTGSELEWVISYQIHSLQSYHRTMQKRCIFASITYPIYLSEQLLRCDAVQIAAIWQMSECARNISNSGMSCLLHCTCRSRDCIPSPESDGDVDVRNDGSIIDQRIPSTNSALLMHLIESDWTEEVMLSNKPAKWRLLTEASCYLLVLTVCHEAYLSQWITTWYQLLLSFYYYFFKSTEFESMVSIAKWLNCDS